MRHILGLSGGKDSAALAVVMHKKIPEMEYFFATRIRNCRKPTIFWTA
jgi:tRNA(Ile)-lysidine synthase TilS/MesJ